MYNIFVFVYIRPVCFNEKASIGGVWSTHSGFSSIKNVLCAISCNASQEQYKRAMTATTLRAKQLQLKAWAMRSCKQELMQRHGRVSPIAKSWANVAKSNVMGGCRQMQHGRMSPKAMLRANVARSKMGECRQMNET